MTWIDWAALAIDALALGIVLALKIWVSKP